ncbi:TetR/AcrR family transcriptional regulator C-terminal domain-containing protein [Aureimonas ureilytica]
MKKAVSRMVRADSPHRRSAAPQGSSRSAIVDAAEMLFLERGFGGVSVDELAAAAGVARRTLYNHFDSKEQIFAEVMSRMSADLAQALPPAVETMGDVKTVLRLVAEAVLEFQTRADYRALVSIVIAEGKQFEWLRGEFAQLNDPYLERFARYLSFLTEGQILACANPDLAARQFIGLFNEALFWPTLMGQSVTLGRQEVIDEAIGMFLLRYQGRS